MDSSRSPHQEKLCRPLFGFQLPPVPFLRLQRFWLFIALWKTHFAKAKFIVIAGTLRLRVYPIKNEGRRWFIASFDAPVSITNEGARPGKILGLRLVLRFSELPIPDNREYFYAKWEVEGSKISRERFTWIDEGKVAHWMPFVVLPKDTVTKHLVFESTWDEPVIQNRIDCSMEIYSDLDRTWQELAQWDVVLSPTVWGELTNRGSAFSYETEVLHREDRIQPPDLHKFTGSKEPIPELGLGAAPSYLDYPDRLKSKD